MKNDETAAKEKSGRDQIVHYRRQFPIIHDIRGIKRSNLSRILASSLLPRFGRSKKKRWKRCERSVPRIIAIISREITTGAKSGKLARCDATTKESNKKGRRQSARSTSTLYITPYNRILKLESSTDDPLRPTTTLIRT